jgi:Ca-activated chloride channel family protein
VPVTVIAGETLPVDVVIGVGRLVLKGKRSEDATDFDDGIRWDVVDAAGEAVTTYGGEVALDLAAGDYTVRASLGEAAVEVPVSVPAGATVEKVVVVATGRAIAHAYFAEDGPAVTADPRFDVIDPVPGTDGNRRTIATNYGDGAPFDLPPGQYVMHASSDAASAEAAFEIKAGPPTEVIVVLNAGILAITAPGGDFLELLGGEKDIYGKQTSVAYTYGESWQLAAPAGDYVLKVRKTDGSESETPLTVKAGERTEVTAN